MSESNSSISTPPAVVDMVRQGLTIVKMENESQQALAIQKPRSEKQVLEGSIEELRMVPELASRAYYSIPYKNRKLDGSEEIVYVEGPSIKSAMALLRRWGNASNGARVIADDGERITVQGVFIDYETNARTLRELSVSRMAYSRSTKQMYRLREDKLTLAIGAAMSKVVRNAILATLPAYLVEKYVSEAKALANQALTKKKNVTDPIAKKQMEKVIAEMIKLGADKEKSLAAVREMLLNDNAQEVLARLQGILNAAKEGQVNLAEVFGSAVKTGDSVQGEIPTVEEILGEPNAKPG